jgi:predicted RNA-binding protein with PIN domain
VNARSHEATLFVDGYNAIGQWSQMRQRSMHKHLERNDLEAARWELIQHLCNYSAYRAFATYLVFDAQYRDDRAVAESITQHLTVHYTEFGQTADTYIEKACALHSRTADRDRHRIIVATSDRAQQMTTIGYGAEWMSVQQLLHDIELAEQQIHRRKRSSRPATGRFLSSRLNDSVRQQLERLRYGDSAPS